MADSMGNQKFKMGYWWVNNKTKVFKLGKVVFIGVDILLFLILGYFLTIYIININTTNQIHATISDQSVLFPDKSPSALQIVNTYSLKAGIGKVDFLAEISNPNENWAVESFTYTFSGGGVQTTPQTSFVLPAQKKNLAQFGIPTELGTGSKPTLSITDVVWTKIKEPLAVVNVEYKELEYSAADIKGEEGESSSLVTGSIFNKSAYGFYDSSLLVVMKFGGSPVGVGRVGLDDFKSFEERPVEIRFSQRYPFNVDINPEFEVNILDENNLILPEG
ncbi:MAG: hypothetical protein ABH835_00095 [Patescibacteria group bacterium]